jgi:CHAT domain-containing protein
LCVTLAAQGTLADRLLNAPDDESVALLIYENKASVNLDLFEACRKAAQANVDRRDYKLALHQFKAALAVAKFLHSARSTAMTLRAIGLAYRRLDNNAQALASYQEGLDAALKAGDLPLQAELLRGLGVTHRALGEFPQAIDADERSLALYRDLKDEHQTAAAMHNLAGNYRMTGDLRKAGELWEESIRIGRQYPDVVNSATSNLAVLASQLGNPEASQAYLEQTNRYAENAHDLHGLTVGLINLGLAYSGSPAQYGEALDSYKRSLVLSAQTHDIMLQSAALVNRAMVYEAQGKRALAIADLQESLRISKAGDSREIQLNTLFSLASLELKSGQSDRAFEHAQQAVAIVEEFRSLDDQWQAFHVFGKCWLQRKDLVNARIWLDRSIAAVELLRSRAGGSEEDGQYFLRARINPYHDLLQLDLDQGLAEEALSLAERAKARQLLDVVRLGKTEPAGSMTDAERVRERLLSSTLSRLDQQLAGAADPKVRDGLQRSLDAAQSEMEAFRMRLYAAHPDLAAQKGDASPIALAQTSELLPDAHTALVEFTSSEDNLFVFTIVRDAQGKPRLRTHTIPWPRKQLTQAVDQFTGKLGARDLGYRASAAQLDNKLMAPLAADLRDCTLLVIVPDGPLWNLPFQALVGPDGRHLIERQAVFYAPSLTYLLESRQPRREVASSAHQLLALGDPDTLQLPDTAREVQQLVKLYGTENSRLLMGSEALKASWEKDAPDYRILHIATHGVLNPKNPMYSYLQFSGKSGTDKLLEAREVVNLKLHPDLVVLSACETGRGRVSIGEGLVGMSWAFLLAGARTTVVSQWKMDSASTTRLMIAMHTSLKPVFTSSDGFGRARSLQKAELQLMRTPEFRHPFYWAGFVMVGDGY